MRYIPKNAEPDFMAGWKKGQLDNGLKLSYNAFPYKGKLNDILREEQRGICCYCQRRIDHYQDSSERGSHNEHLYPENRPSDPTSFARQLDYNNIFACCIDSKGHKDYEQYLRHCGESKGNDIIPELIKESDCSDYFRYNFKGEIVPNGKFYSWDEYVAHKDDLSGKVLEAFECVDKLNLNCITLVNYRWEMQSAMISAVKSWNPDRINSYISGMLNSKPYPELIDMRLQYLKERIKIVTGN